MLFPTIVPVNLEFYFVHIVILRLACYLVDRIMEHPQIYAAGDRLLHCDMGKRPYVPRRLWRKTCPGPSHWGTMIEVNIGGLPAYHDKILLTICNNPSSRCMEFSAIMEKTYGVRIHHAALEKYIVRNNLFVHLAAPSTPMRSTGAPSTPTGAPEYP